MARDQERFAQTGPSNPVRAGNGTATPPALRLLVRLLARHAAEEDACRDEEGPRTKGLIHASHRPSSRCYLCPLFHRQAKETSVEDQFRLCRRHCDQKGWQVTEVFADHGISGTTSQRPDYLRLLQAAERGEVDIIVAESLNRLSRDQADTASLFKRMSFFGVRLHTVADQDLDELKVGVGSLVSALYIKDIAQKTRRGLEGRVVAGKSAGGLSYGYRVKREIRADGTATTGDLTIEPSEAEVVNRFSKNTRRGSPRAPLPRP